MIIDKITNAYLYYGLGKRIETALKAMVDIDITQKVGKHWMQGEEIYYLIQEYITKDLTQGRWEAHKNHIDIQYILSGRENIYYNNVNNLQPKDTYIEERDVYYLTGSGEKFLLEKGYFMILFPQDAHMACINTGTGEPVKKVTMKILTDQG